MNSGYEITMFGEFTISNGTEIITDQANRSKKVWTLLEYLIVHRDRSVTQKALVDLLWPGNDTKDPINTLKVLMHRVRSLLDELGKDSGKKMIYYKSGAYGWNSELNCVVDTEKFTTQTTACSDTGRRRGMCQGRNSGEKLPYCAGCINDTD